MGHPGGSETHRLINPASEAEICKIPMGNKRDVDAAVVAKGAFLVYSQFSKDERLSLLRKLHALYNEAFDEIATLMMDEMGSTQAFSVDAGVDWRGTFRGADPLSAFRRAAGPAVEGAGRRLCADHALELADEPAGAKVVPALAAGCTMIAKLEYYLSSLWFAELVHEVLSTRRL